MLQAVEESESEESSPQEPKLWASLQSAAITPSLTPAPTVRSCCISLLHLTSTKHERWTESDLQTQASPRTGSSGGHLGKRRGAPASAQVRQQASVLT